MKSREFVNEARAAIKLAERAVSQAQQKFMGMAHAMQKGKRIPGASAELKKVVRSMKPSDVKDFAKTSHKGLPKRKSQEAIDREQLAKLAPPKNKVTYADRLTLMKNPKALSEKWGVDTKVGPTERGKYSGKTKTELAKAYNALKKSGPHSKGSPEYGRMRELAFAIRAKTGWGKVE
jgi:hypothetical protein